LKFNKDQLEGVAKVVDNLATAAMVAAMVGGFVDHKIGWGTILALFVMFVVLVSAGISLRKSKGDGHGN
jgi:hypothetical protein